jgi:hypothetical protein
MTPKIVPCPPFLTNHDGAWRSMLRQWQAPSGNLLPPPKQHFAFATALQEGCIKSCLLLHEHVVLMGKNHITKERGEGFGLFFVSPVEVELAEQWVDAAIAINRGKQ